MSEADLNKFCKDSQINEVKNSKPSLTQFMTSTFELQLTKSEDILKANKKL